MLYRSQLEDHKELHLLRRNYEAACARNSSCVTVRITISEWKNELTVNLSGVLVGGAVNLVIVTNSALAGP